VVESAFKKKSTSGDIEGRISKVYVQDSFSGKDFNIFPKHKYLTNGASLAIHVLMQMK